MIDMVEAQVIAGQMATQVVGKRIVAAALGERKKKSMRDAHLLRVKPDEFRARLEGNIVAGVFAKHRHVCLETDGGWGMDVWDVYGRILWAAPGAKIPGNPPISLGLDDGSTLIVLPGVWAAMRLASNEDLETFRASSDPDVLDITSDAFTVAALQRLVGRDEFAKSTIKEIMARVASPCLVGMAGCYSQEALYRAKIHPRRKAPTLTEAELVALHGAMVQVARDALAAGGRASERDLFDQPGGFVPVMSREMEGAACPVCGAAIASLNLGRAHKYYFCPGCQALQGARLP